MKKLFSILAAVLFAGSMMASVVTLDPSTQTDAPASSNAGDPIELTINGITIAYQGAVNASTAPADFRVYANQNLTLSATSNISKVTIAGKANKAGWAPTVSAGEITTGASYEGITTKATLEDPLFVVENINAQSISITCNKQLRAYMIEVTLDGGDVPPVEPTMNYYVAGSMTNWGPMAAYKLAANPANEGEYMGEFTFAANDEFKVGYSDGITIESTNYFPNGMDNNYVITEAGDYTVYFRPDGQGGEDWHYGCINAIKKEEPVIPQYEVAEAIAAGLTDDTEILVRGVITKMEFKGKNFAKYGSVNIYVADATGAEGAFEFYNCYSLNADTFRTSDPAYDPESTAWAEYNEVADENGNAIHVGDTVIAFGKYKLYNETYELNTGCYLTEIKHAGEVPPTPEHTYTVAGGSDVLFGTTWAPANTANDMALVEGLYTWEKSELTLAAGNIEFKVCEDHAWTTAYPAQNYQLAISEAGIYTITITFDPANDNAVNAVATKTGDAVVIPTVAMHGNFLGSWADTENFEVAEGNATASLSLNIAAGNYEFGMRIGGSGNWTANGAAFTRENNSAEVVAGQGNLTLAADVEGEYLFTWTFATNSLAITYPEAPVVPDTIVIDIESGVAYTDMVAAQGWWQFMAENDEYEISISNVSTTQAAGVYTVADLDQDYTYVYIKADSTEVHFVDGEFTLTEGEDGSRTIEGVMTGDDGNIYNIKLVFRIPTAETTVNVEIPNWGVADAADIYGYTGTLFYGEAADSTYIQFVVLGNNPIGTFTYDDMLPTATGIEVGGEYKAIYSMNVTVNVSDAQRAIITMDILCLNNTLYHVTTLVGEGVDAIEAAQKAVKMIQNGQLIIEKNGVRYNANGQIVR